MVLGPSRQAIEVTGAAFKKDRTAPRNTSWLPGRDGAGADVQCLELYNRAHRRKTLGCRLPRRADRLPLRTKKLRGPCTQTRCGKRPATCSRASPSPGGSLEERLGLRLAPGGPGALRLRRDPILAQVLPVITFARRLPLHWLAFIDNVAGQFALKKGYGRNPAVNGALVAFWRLAADRAWCPEFYRVPSASNFQTPAAQA